MIVITAVLFWFGLTSVCVGEPIPSIVQLKVVPYDVNAFWTKERMASAVTWYGWDKENNVPVTEPPNPRVSPPVSLLRAPPAGTKKIPTANLTMSPYAAMGKVFFSYNGGTASCSATAVAPNVVISAGHCVIPAGCNCKTFYQNWMFQPHYHMGQGAQKLRGERQFVSTLWSVNAVWAADVSFVVVPGAGATAGLTLPILIGENRRRKTYACGWPKASDDTETLACTYNPSNNAGQNMWMLSKLNFGASGGPWVTSLSIGGPSSNNINQVFGVNSHIVEGKFQLYSPRFGPTARALFLAANKTY